MLVLSKNEVKGLEQLALQKRKQRLQKQFLIEAQESGVEYQELVDFFDKGFDAAISLAAVSDKEILNLCRIGLIKRTHVKATHEFNRCRQEKQWAGRSLFLSGCAETLMDSKSIIKRSS